MKEAFCTSDSQLFEIVNQYFETISATEISTALGIMLDNYYHHAPMDRKNFAELSFQIHNTLIFFFNLEKQINSSHPALKK